MTEEEMKDLIEKLRKGEIQEFLIKKEDFLTFREVLVSQEDFKHFKGIAQHGGNVIYQYLQIPRS
ncbi:hypothetical protein [Heyndrickxia ginsengihumi]|uniref:Abortive phage infection protein n=1 Tax=Heyndrickxia ginsengihumi TaxID=363870 RepID=A0A6M0P240_9BACI|nr:hypothetical protein [Heyndrickxia ginsengihumi]MBE6183583.1 hypothetical protein [Bacillus sp. (in: firmicutes)]MCM3024940.1 hypothetical protein [Heyndrickxia ginsengihumi]NEY18726.1 hypothetical protein [Heyndrickxia ginsengihumi]